MAQTKLSPKKKNFKLHASCGSNFDGVSQKAKDIATKEGVIVEFEFNTKKCLVSKDTNLEWLFRDFRNAFLMQWKTVGPDCVEHYSDEVSAEFVKRNRALNRQLAREDAKRKRKDEREKKELDDKVKGIELELKDRKGWEECRRVNSDGYGGAALDYAEAWAKLMQIEIANGKTIPECYDDTQKGLGFLGITGFQFGCAVNILALAWKYGEELRKYHNKEWGVSEDAEGTVNPAVLSFG